MKSGYLLWLHTKLQNQSDNKDTPADGQRSWPACQAAKVEITTKGFKVVRIR